MENEPRTFNIKDFILLGNHIPLSLDLTTIQELAALINDNGPITPGIERFKDQLQAKQCEDLDNLAPGRLPLMVDYNFADALVHFITTRPKTTINKAIIHFGQELAQAWAKETDKTPR